MDGIQVITIGLSSIGIISNIVLAVILYLSKENSRLKDQRITAIEDHLDSCDRRHELAEKQLATFATLNAVIDVRLQNIIKLIEKLEVIVEKLSNDK